jgi:predicted P-loop ATPase
VRSPVQQFAEHYIRNMGFTVVRLKPWSKEAYDKGWRGHVFTSEDFLEGHNIGIQSVKHANGADHLVIDDLDAPEAVALADAFLPETGAVYGRQSKPRSKRLYLVPDLSLKGTHVFRDQFVQDKKKATLLELRVNHQDMAPPSVHPSGEPLKWDGLLLPPDRIAQAEAFRHAQLLATASAVARYYNPSGNRNEWCMALAGCLRLLGVSEEEAWSVVGTAGRYVGDTDPGRRESEIRRTFARADDEPYTRDTALAELIGGECGQAFIRTLQKIWRGGGRDPRGFVTNSNGLVVAKSQENIRMALEKLGIRLSKDVFSGKELIQCGESSIGLMDDEETNRTWLKIDSTFHFLPTREFFDDVTSNMACETKIHPVLEYLAALEWDGEKRIDKWLHTYGQARDTAYVSAVGALVLIAAVRRVRQPGCKFDELLILESKQGQNKSEAMKALCPNVAWFSDDLPLGVDAQKTIERTSGKWIIEAQELVNMRRTQVEKLKSFLSRGTDGPVRLAYGHKSDEVPRKFIVIGTTNDKMYLKDNTGNRRFWPVAVVKFDLDAIIRDRDQLWAEAAHRDAAGESIRLKPELYGAAAEEQEARRSVDPWEAVFEDWLGWEKQGWVSADQAWRHLGIPKRDRTQNDNERLGSAIRRLGFERKQKKLDGSPEHGYRRGEVTEWLFTETECPRTEDDRSEF